MRIFITGGKGFIGSRVVRELKKRKHTVYLLSARLAQTKAVEGELKKFKPDCVIHLAWEGLPDVGPAMSKKNKLNSLQFFKLIEKHPVQKLVATGTAWEYESPRELRAHKHNAFIAAKLALKEYGKNMMQKNNGIFVWVTPFFVYGSGKKAVSLIPSLIMQAKKGETPTPRNADAWHDFIYVDDVARAIILLATRKVPTGSYDIGSGALTRTGDIAREVARLYKLPLLPLRRVSKKGVKAHMPPLKKVTGWKQRTSIPKGLRAMVKEMYGAKI